MDTPLTRPNLFKKFFTIFSILLAALALLAGCASAPYVQPFDNKDYDLAIAKAKEVLNEKPQDSRAWYYLGRSYLEEGQYAKAEKALHKALRNPDYYWKEDMLRQLARVYMKTGDYDRALEEYDRLLKEYPKAVSDWTDRGLACVYKGSYREALQNFKKAIRLEKEKHRRNSRSPYYDGSRHEEKIASNYRGMAFAHLGLGEPEKALYMMDKAKRIYPKYDTTLDLALIYYASGAENRLKDHFSSTGLSISRTEMDRYPVIAPLIEIRDARRQAIQEVVNVENRGEMRTAFQMYMKLLDKYPDDFDVLSKIIELAKNFDPPPAIPEGARKHAVWGETAAKNALNNRDFGRVIDEYQKAIRLAPWWTDLYINTALIMEQVGRTDDAAKYLKLYLVAASNAPDAKQVQTKIYELEYAKQLKKKQMQDWVGIWVPTAPVVTNVTNANGTYASSLKDYSFKVIEVSEFGDVTVEVYQGSYRKGGSGCSVVTSWAGNATPTSLNAELPGRRTNQKNNSTYTLGPGQLDMAVEQGTTTAKFSFKCHWYPHSIFDLRYSNTEYSYNGPVSRKE
jgi:tetratricopeptide (TPR) repeat protein